MIDAAIQSAGNIATKSIEGGHTVEFGFVLLLAFVLGLVGFVVYSFSKAFPGVKKAIEDFDELINSRLDALVKEQAETNNKIGEANNKLGNLFVATQLLADRVGGVGLSLESNFKTQEERATRAREAYKHITDEIDQMPKKFDIIIDRYKNKANTET
jgi:phage-related minor tail protein